MEVSVFNLVLQLLCTDNTPRHLVLSSLHIYEKKKVLSLISYSTLLFTIVVFVFSFLSHFVVKQIWSKNMGFSCSLQCSCKFLFTFCIM